MLQTIKLHEISQWKLMRISSSVFSLFVLHFTGGQKAYVHFEARAETAAQLFLKMPSGGKLQNNVTTTLIKT